MACYCTYQNILLLCVVTVSCKLDSWRVFWQNDCFHSLPFKLTFKGPEVFACLWQVPKGHTQVFSKINTLCYDSSSALCFGRDNLVKTSQHKQAWAVWRARRPGMAVAWELPAPPWDPAWAPPVSAGRTTAGKCGTRQPASNPLL